MADDLDIGSSKDQLGRENVAPEGRRGRSDGGLQGHEGSQQYGIDARTDDIGLKYRAQDEDGHDGIHEHAGHEVDHHHDEDHPQHAGVGAEQGRQDLLGDLHEADHPGKGLPGAHEDEHDPGDHAGLEKGIHDALESEAFINHGLQKKGVGHRRGRGLGGAEISGIDAAHDDDRKPHDRQAVLDRLPAFGPVGAGQYTDFFDLGVHEAIGGEHEQDHQARENSGQKEHPDGGAGGHAVDDESDARGDQEGDVAGVDNEAQGKGALVTGLQKHGPHGPPDGGHGGLGRPGYRPEEGTAGIGGNGQPPGHMAHEGLDHPDQAPGGLAGGNDAGRQDEHGHAHQRRRGDAGNHLLHHCDHQLGGKIRHVDINVENQGSQQGHHEGKPEQKHCGQADAE